MTIATESSSSSSSVSNNLNRPIDWALLPVQKQAAARQMNIIYPQVLEHNAKHDAFKQGCIVCTIKALNAVEDDNRLAEQASIFLATLDKNEVLNDINSWRLAVGDDALPWMNKPEYLR